jgi:hypothetical protein
MMHFQPSYQRVHATPAEIIGSVFFDLRIGVSAENLIRHNKTHSPYYYPFHVHLFRTFGSSTQPKSRLPGTTGHLNYMRCPFCSPRDRSWELLSPFTNALVIPKFSSLIYHVLPFKENVARFGGLDLCWKRGMTLFEADDDCLCLCKQRIRGNDNAWATAPDRTFHLS